MIRRKIQDSLLQMHRAFKVVTITGPRQAGKTTLCREVFAEKKYISLEDPDIRLFCQTDPRGFLAEIKTGAILDEIQRVPEFLSYLQTYVDSRSEKGLFILTGSNQLTLNEQITQSLAGRTGLLTLLPFAMSEINQQLQDFTLEKILQHGFYPGSFDLHMTSSLFFKSYYQTYVERDVSALIKLKDHVLFEKFVRLCAGRVGQICDYSSLSNDVGVSVPTIQSWLSVLEASFIIFRLPPYFENYSKRMIKSPKLYFYDVGLLAYLLDVRTESELRHHSARGVMFENLVIVDQMKEFLNDGEDVRLYFMRDAKGHEIDLMYQMDGKTYLIEIKSAATITQDFFNGLHFYRDLLQANGKEVVLSVIYSGEREYTQSDIHIRNFRTLFVQSLSRA